MENCKNCEHSVFDPLWGEYKCKARETRIYILLDSSECSDYKKGPEKTFDEDLEE